MIVSFCVKRVFFITYWRFTGCFRCIYFLLIINVVLTSRNAKLRDQVLIFLNFRRNSDWAYPFDRGIRSSWTRPHWCVYLLWKRSLFHTYWDFWIESIAWKTHTKISSSNDNRETTFSHVGKAFHPIKNQLSKWISQFATPSRCCLRVFSLHSQKFVKSPQVYTSFLAN